MGKEPEQRDQKWWAKLSVTGGNAYSLSPRAYRPVSAQSLYTCGMSIRPVKQIISARPTMEGAGVKLKRG
ncbi:MAG: hypothetical protein ABMA15_03555, partial [Vicinamibacterales bacterium]